MKKVQQHKCDLCGAIYRRIQEVGIHKRAAHGIKGKSSTAIKRQELKMENEIKAGKLSPIPPFEPISVAELVKPPEPRRAYLKIENLSSYEVKVTHVLDNGNEYYTVYKSLLGMVLNEVINFVMNAQEKEEE